MWTITKHIDVSCGHRLEGHFKCGRLHGHNYRIAVTVSGNKLDSHGMIMDFGELKKALKHIHDMLDHKYIVSEDNLAKNDWVIRPIPNEQMVHLAIKHSTAEEIARWVAIQIMEFIPNGVSLRRVTVEETRSSRATYELDR